MYFFGIIPAAPCIGPSFFPGLSNHEATPKQANKSIYRPHRPRALNHNPFNQPHSNISRGRGFGVIFPAFSPTLTKLINARARHQPQLKRSEYSRDGPGL